MVPFVSPPSLEVELELAHPARREGESVQALRGMDSRRSFSHMTLSSTQNKFRFPSTSPVKIGVRSSPGTSRSG